MATLSKDQVREIIAKAPAGTTPEGIIAALREQGHQLEGYGAPVSAHQAFGQALSAVAPDIPAGLSVLPAVLGGVGQHVGGLIGGAGGVAGGPAAPATVPAGVVAGESIGGGLGAGLGSAIQQAGLAALGSPGAPTSVQQAARRVGVESAIGAAGGPTGRIVGKGASFIGGKLMQSALAPGVENAAAMAKQALGENVAATKAGLAKLDARIAQQAARADDVVRSFDAANPGAKIPTSAFLARVQQLVTETKAGISPGDAKTFTRMGRQFLAEHPNGLSGEELLKLTRDARQAASATYKEGSTEALRAKFARALADRGSEILHGTPGLPGNHPFHIPGNIFPGLAEIESETSRLIGLRDALTATARKGTSVVRRFAPRLTSGALAGAAGALTPGPPGRRLEAASTAAALGTILGTPSLLSQVGLALNNPAIAPVIANLFRAGGNAVTQAAGTQ